MESKGSLPYSQDPTTGLYPEPDEVTPHTYTLFLRSILILSSHVRLGLLKGLFLLSILTKMLHAFLTSPVHIPLQFSPLLLIQRH
jgi:hypothetical protein